MTFQCLESGDSSLSGQTRKYRRPVTLPGHALLEDGTTFSIRILDLSYDGCKIETSVALLPGVPLKLAVVRLGAVDAQVRWCRGGYAGLAFEPAETGLASEEKRKHQRFDVEGQVLLRAPGRPTYQTRVFDLTPSGCKIEFVERPRSGDKLWIKLDSLEALASEVRWTDDFVGGVEFSRAIYPAVFELLLVRLGGQAATQ